MIIEKATEILRDALVGDGAYRYGNLDNREVEELTPLEIAELKSKDGEIQMQAMFVYETYGRDSSVLTIEKEEEGERSFTTAGEKLGMEFEQRRGEDDQYSDNAGDIRIRLSEIKDVESGVRLTLSIDVEGCDICTAMCDEMQSIFDIPAFGYAKITAKGELSLSYDIVLGDEDSFSIYGVRVFNTLAEDLIDMYFEAKQVINEFVGIEGEE